MKGWKLSVDFCEHKYALASQGNDPGGYATLLGNCREKLLPSNTPQKKAWGAGCGGEWPDCRGSGWWFVFFHLISQDAILQNRELWLLIKKEFGFYSKSQYKTWQKKLAEDPTWPPTNRTDYSGDGKSGFYINQGYENSEQRPREKLERGRQATEEHFWTIL